MSFFILLFSFSMLFSQASFKPNKNNPKIEFSSSDFINMTLSGSHNPEVRLINALFDFKMEGNIAVFLSSFTNQSISLSKDEYNDFLHLLVINITDMSIIRWTPVDIYTTLNNVNNALFLCPRILKVDSMKVVLYFSYGRLT